MSGLFYSLGRRAAPGMLKLRWMYHSLAGDGDESISAERQLGGLLLKEFAAQNPLAHHPVLDRINDSLCQRLTNPAWKISVLRWDSPDCNAFALPGGFVAVGGGLMKLCEENPDELSFVIGHEIGHAVLRHSRNRLVSGSVGKLSRNLLMRHRGVARLAGPFIDTLLQQGYARVQEFEADQFGFRLARAAGFDPAGGIRLLERLAAQPDSQAEGLSAYLASHPPLPVRMETLRRFSRRPLPSDCQTF